MNIYIAHYHLHPGGVTRIIQSQIKSLKSSPEEISITLLCGDCQNPEMYENMGARVVIEPMLNYLYEKDLNNLDLPGLLRKMTVFFTDTLNRGDVLHFHNLNLGKNPVVTYAVHLLLNKDIKVLNHAHDFAEDRPANWKFLKTIIEEIFQQSLREILYPHHKNYHLAVINSFDLERLAGYEIPGNNLHWLPNPVEIPHLPQVKTKHEIKEKVHTKLHVDNSKKLITYPVRAIRRKNIGELILLSILFKDAQWSITQAPKNPQEIPEYEKWENFCSEYNLPVIFEAGEKVNFEDLLIASDFCITTSLREGFGMAYLEPWIYETPVIGRNLKHLTKDFIEKKVEFRGLYDTIMINFERQQVDFKDIIADNQRIYLKLLIQNEISSETIFEQNPMLKHLLDEAPEALIRKNKKAIEENFSLKEYGNKLSQIYQKSTGKAGEA